MMAAFPSTATADTAAERRQVIASAITQELERQERAGVARIDIAALAEAVAQALLPAPTNGEGRHPDELNATNDD